MTWFSVVIRECPSYLVHGYIYDLACFVYRFSPLLEEETVGICLDKEDPQVTLAVLILLTHIVKSPTIVGLLCSHQG